MSEKHNESADVFRPNPTSVNIGGVEYQLVYDLNAFCELEKIYPSIDALIQKLLSGPKDSPDLTKVTYVGVPARAKDVAIDGVTLADYIASHSNEAAVKFEDTRNLLWAGCLHDHVVTNANGDITGYTISKNTLSAGVTLKNMRDINGAIITAILRDLLPTADVKNEDAPSQMESQEAPAAPDTPLLVLRK